MSLNILRIRILKTFLIRKYPDPDGIISEYSHTFKKEIMTLHRFYWRIGKRGGRR
jgi:hypothetical protein